ncbi:hypothetical protein J1TS3_11150 [Siminovitchia fordii]|uniref:Prepilin-type N-terminal cleavage/methylation domain-containing protein n=2 Tax=Siminovitchia fordii TaxID=254759 RepID=A0ABQ4K2I9_9BACI|nr:hypothetical protein J1TS3_11150 [Siminovitchia fordii]
MSSMKKKRIVLTEQSGFTLLEAIFTIFIITVVISLLPLMYYWLFAIDRSLSPEEDFEWNIFLIQLRDELAAADSFRNGSERIYLLKNRVSIKYERHSWNIRRQVGDMGHEVVLQNVRRFEVKEEAPMLAIHVEFLNGTKEEARFLMPAGEEGSTSIVNEDPSSPSH